jgi:hypothetical protein
MMQSGLLWYDGSRDRKLAAKVEDAARRYREKFGVTPDTCYVNQAALDGQLLTVPLAGLHGKALRVLPAPNVLPHHFWIGVEELKEERAAD